MRLPHVPFVILLTSFAASCVASAPPAPTLRYPAPEVVSDGMKSDRELAVVIHQIGADLGTGVVVRTDGYVLTNQHVIDPSCTTDQKTGQKSCPSGQYEVCTVDSFIESCVPATLVAADADLDLALLKASKTFARAAVFGNAEKLQPAERVYEWTSVGMQLPPTLFLGRFANWVNPNYIPGERRRLLFDMSTNHGSSGGPIFNARGEVVALTKGFLRVSNNGLGTDTGTPLAHGIPSSDIRTFLQTTVLANSMVKGGK